MDQDLEYFAPEYALEEINRHIVDILKKTHISEKEFKVLRADLAIFVEFAPLDEYKEFLPEALSLIPMYSNDIDFLALALALKLKLPLWSNDPHLKTQSKVKVYNTSELLEELGL